MDHEQSDTMTSEIVETCLGLVQAMHTVATPALCQMDVTMSQVKAMLTISMKSIASVGDIAQVTGVGLPAASTTVDRLVNLGWAHRAEDPNDRRRTLVRLTDEGRQIIDTVWRLRRDLLQTWVGRLNDEDKASLARGMAALGAAAKASSAEAPVALTRETRSDRVAERRLLAAKNL
jgi:DNA-binding MarR family transcriptional regulator